MQHPAGGSVWGAVLLTVFFGVVLVGVAILVLLNRGAARKVVLGGLLAAATAVAAFQAGHMFEHIAPFIGIHGADEFMTPWGEALAAGYARLDVHNPYAGMEILHLVGNAIFLVGVVALVALTSRLAPGGPAHHSARWCLWIQGAHVVEHVLLTSTVLIGGKALGLSSFFVPLDSDSAMWIYRLWWHFVVNLVATILMGRAMYEVWRSLDLDAAVRRTARADPVPV